MHKATFTIQDEHRSLAAVLHGLLHVADDIDSRQLTNLVVRKLVFVFDQPEHAKLPIRFVRIDLRHVTVMQHRPLGGEHLPRRGARCGITALRVGRDHKRVRGGHDRSLAAEQCHFVNSTCSALPVAASIVTSLAFQLPAMTVPPSPTRMSM